MNILGLISQLIGIKTLRLTVFFYRCLIGVVVAEIIASPHALDSCECMNIEGQTLRKTCGRLGVM